MRRIQKAKHNICLCKFSASDATRKTLFKKACACKHSHIGINAATLSFSEDPAAIRQPDISQSVHRLQKANCKRHRALCGRSLRSPNGSSCCLPSEVCHRLGGALQLQISLPFSHRYNIKIHSPNCIASKMHAAHLAKLALPSRLTIYRAICTAFPTHSLTDLLARNRFIFVTKLFFWGFICLLRFMKSPQDFSRVGWQSWSWQC